MNKLLSFEQKTYAWMAKNGFVLLRISIGIVFLWYGIQKFFPGVSSAEELATRTIEMMTFGMVKQTVSLPLLAAWEAFLGITFITGRLMRIAVPLLFLQMIGTLMPLFLFPSETFESIPFVPTLVGQYIFKNIVVITGVMVVAAHHFEFLSGKRQ